MFVWDTVKCKHCESELALQITALRAKGKITFVGWLGILLGY